MELNKIYNENCLDTMTLRMEDNIIDLVLTSPPYDKFRDYDGYTFQFENIAKCLYRVIKEGGVLVWVVGDSIINNSESLTSFKQALYFKELGFYVHDTMIYQKDVMPFPESNRYNQCFEYMFIFSKGKPKTFNPIKEKTLGYSPSISSSTRNKDGTVSRLKYEQGKEERSRFNIWKYSCGYNKSTTDKKAFLHPATFPEKLAKDHIISWSNVGDLIYDPFIGSGTVGKCCVLLNRKFIGSEISQKYCDIANNRIEQYKRQQRLSF